MHPVSTVLFLLGYGIALPILFRITTVVDRQHRLAMTGHQIGLVIATVGWLLRGRPIVAVVHVVWMVVVRLWFAAAAPSAAAGPSAEPGR